MLSFFCEIHLQPVEVRVFFHTLDKYARTLEDIERLEEVIGLQKAVTAKEFQDQKLISQGISQGAFEMAIKVKKALGIDKAVEITGFSREELEKEKINKD